MWIKIAPIRISAILAGCLLVPAVATAQIVDTTITYGVTIAEFADPRAVAVDPQGTIYVVDAFTEAPAAASTSSIRPSTSTCLPVSFGWWLTQATDALSDSRLNFCISVQSRWIYPHSRRHNRRAAEASERRRAIRCGTQEAVQSQSRRT